MYQASAPGGTLPWMVIRSRAWSSTREQNESLHEGLAEELGKEI
jgi:hypothetical protein